MWQIYWLISTVGMFVCHAQYSTFLGLNRRPYGSGHQVAPGPAHNNYNQYGGLDTPSLLEEPEKHSSKCFDDAGKPQKCVPEFVNAAFLRHVEATNTCGESRSQQFCLQTGHGSNKQCELCDTSRSEYSHPPSYLTDVNKNDNQTWWQSETLLDMPENNQINLTLNLGGKAYDITYVRLIFKSPRPESFAIYKRSAPDGPWIPYQFYSAACRNEYSLPDYMHQPSIRQDKQAEAICTSEFSDISPLTGANVAFSTLEHRPSRHEFDYSVELQEWVTVTDIMIVLDNLNTFGDEVFGDPRVLKSYFYAISDLAVGGQCKCNGHASDCVPSTGPNGEPSRACVCEHYTTGPDCEICLPFYNDHPWKRASDTDANDCRPCNCNGFSNRCYFDPELYESTGHGGHCLDCANNRAGANCERCREEYYERSDGSCVACNCDSVGSRSLQCLREGICQCKPGVIGDKCDQCDVNYFDFSSQGCKPCGCNTPGSYGNRPYCNPVDGICSCKENVEGQQCDTCKLGHFNLDQENEFGCTPCFCYGHSSICSSAPGYSKASIESRFVRGEERWTAWESAGREFDLTYNAVGKEIQISGYGNDNLYFQAPSRFLGDQRSSYNHDLSFILRVGESGPQSSTMDILLEGGGRSISTNIFAQGNPLPTTQKQDYKFRLHEDGNFGWSPRLSSIEFMALLTNMTAIRIRGTYGSYGANGFLDDFALETTRQRQFGEPATWIETCSCPEGYVGQFCESCAPGFRHHPANGGPFATCIPCDCNNHADICDAETGQCICHDNTAGTQCERCARGYFGNALKGTPNDCEACPCPNGGACLTLIDESVVCLECPEGYTGPRCEICTDGYFGDPRGRTGAPKRCEKCDCNDNIDPNAVSNCNRTTGKCLKCIHNTGGHFCDQCLPGFYGNALALSGSDCGPCRCNVYGTTEEQYGPPVCDQISGQCDCKAYVTGRTCDKCQHGYWNLTSGIGCEDCGCDPVGAFNSTCDVDSGQCFCRDGVTGRKCDTCEPYHYGFSDEGCKPCDCDDIGSTSLQCGADGQCMCRENVEGRRCNRCRENTFDKQAGCRDCPACYTLVLDAVSVHRERLAELERLLRDIVSNPTVLNDEAFERSLSEVMSSVDEMWKDAQAAQSAGGEETVDQHLKELRERIERVRTLLGDLRGLMHTGGHLAREGEGNVTHAENIIDAARHALRDAHLYLDVEGNRALDKATDRSNQFGQQSQRMSEIAREARRLADKHEDDEKAVTQIAYDARNISHDAHVIIRKAFDSQTNLTDVIKDLQSQSSSLALQHDTVLTSASETLDEAKISYREALNLSTVASSLAVPRLNVSEMTDTAIDLEEKGKRIKIELENLMDGRRELLEELETQLISTNNLKEKGLQQQQFTAELLASGHNAKKEAEEAVEKADQTLVEAEQTLRTLEGFDQKVQESRGAANMALDRVNEIEGLIVKAEGLTNDAQDALRGAESNAKDARDIARSAQETAESASRHAHDVRGMADDTKVMASKLKDAADNIALDVDAAGQIVRNYEDQAQSDKDMVFQAQIQANTAKDQAETASKRVQEAYELVQEILHFLDQALNLDTSELDRLEQRLEEAYRLYIASDLERSAAELKDAHSWQQREISRYEMELRMLRIEVDNIEEIKVSLPKGCFKQSRIET